MDWFPGHLFILYLLQNACIALQLHNKVHVTLYRRFIGCHSVLVNPENVISSCLVKRLLLVGVWMTLWECIEYYIEFPSALCVISLTPLSFTLFVDFALA